MSSKPSTPIASRRWTPESERSRIPISLSPVPFRRTNSMRLRTNCLLNETTLKQHNRNLQQTRATVDRNQKQLKLNLNYQRRGSLLMDAKSDSNGVDSGGTVDEVDKSSTCNHSNGSVRRSSFNRNGMVRDTRRPSQRRERRSWTGAKCLPSRASAFSETPAVLCNQALCEQEERLSRIGLTQFIDFPVCKA